MITYLRICKSSRNKLITVFWKFFFFTVKIFYFYDNVQYLYHMIFYLCMYNILQKLNIANTYYICCQMNAICMQQNVVNIEKWNT